MSASGPVIWVEGNIGAGKSTFSKVLSDVMRFRLFEEPVKTNPYLELFYRDQRRYALEMQLYLMKRRHVMQKLAALEAEFGYYSGCVLDRGLPGDRVFARMQFMRGNIDQVGWNAYEEAFNYACIDIRPPSLLVFLDVEPDVSLRRIKERSRTAEMGVDLKYLEELRGHYLDLLAQIEQGNHAWSKGISVMRVPWNADHQPFMPIIDQVCSKIGMYRPS